MNARGTLGTGDAKEKEAVFPIEASDPSSLGGSCTWTWIIFCMPQSPPHKIETILLQDLLIVKRSK